MVKREGEHNICPLGVLPLLFPRGQLLFQVGLVAVEASVHSVRYLLFHLRAHLADRVQVQVNGPEADLTAAGRADQRTSRAGKHSAEKDHGGTHLAHQVIGDLPCGYVRRVHRHMRPLAGDPASQPGKDLYGGVHVRDLGYIIKLHRALAQDAGGKDRQRGILGTLAHRLALQRTAAADQITAHGIPPFHAYFSLYRMNERQSV